MNVNSRSQEIKKWPVCPTGAWGSEREVPDTATPVGREVEWRAHRRLEVTNMCGIADSYSVRAPSALHGPSHLHQDSFS